MYWLQRLPLIASLVLVGPLVHAAGAAAGAVDFSRDIRPILSDRCFRCHGPDAQERKGDLRLDEQASATMLLPTGATAIVPGDHQASEMVRRILSDDEAERMPPAELNKPLTAAEKGKLVQWIQEGAEYRQHWSFVRPQRPAAPAHSLSGWARNPIDDFVADRLQRGGIQPAPEANRETLLRRLSLDLTGLPPTLDQMDAFLADQDEHAYERLVDRLLESPHFGERMALDWLDAARFADTNGYHLDNGRDMTHWRAWVIQAYNSNLPFDEFTVQQIAGDLLPFATRDQKVASGFNRNHMINFEGGASPEEYLNAYIVDRVNTTGAVWLGLTVACAQCHDHKYDPLTQREFYQMYAFFNRVPEAGLAGDKGNAEPIVTLPTTEQSQRLDELDGLIRETTAERSKRSADLDVAQRESRDAELGGQLESLQKERDALFAALPTTMVMQDVATPRDTFVLTRGRYDAAGEPVTASVPAAFHAFPDDAPRSRLGLARWLVDLDNPLTARVIVNRYWQMIFGTGLVKTAEDFGSQGESPSHPELLDWLACEFQRSTQMPVAGTGREAWNTKGILRLIVTSATYRQTSQVPADQYAHDPENRLLARGSRHRLPAEFVRDQALSVSGLIRHKIGGPSVSPYQPEELWGELSSRADSAKWTAQFFQLSTGDDLYRRSMYTFWKRSSPSPQMSTFDAPDRETCVMRRARTNTPLQALILMNDPTYIEAARKLAERVLGERVGGEDERLAAAFRIVTGRRPAERELAVLRNVLATHVDYYARHPEQATELLTKNGASPPAHRPAGELAAWSMFASTLLNLDEVICRN